MNNELRNALAVSMPIGRGAWGKELMKRIGIRVYNLIDAMLEEDEDAE